MQIPKHIAVVALILFLTGCDNAARTDDKHKLHDALTEASQLKLQSNEQQRRIEELESQLTTLRGFGQDRLSQLVTVASISLGRFTLPYDLNEDGLDDGVNVYVTLKDKRNDTIKAGGQIDITLLDLAAEPGSRDVGNWRFSPPETADHWLGGFGTNHFKFQLAWPNDNLPTHAKLTVLVSFKDSLTGSTFETQKVITAAILPE